MSRLRPFSFSFWFVMLRFGKSSSSLQVNISSKFTDYISTYLEERSQWSQTELKRFIDLKLRASSLHKEYQTAETFFTNSISLIISAWSVSVFHSFFIVIFVVFNVIFEIFLYTFLLRIGGFELLVKNKMLFKHQVI